MPVDFRSAMAAVPTAVSVAAIVDEYGLPRGLTIGSLVSLSLDPPLVLFCLDRARSAHAAFTAASRFAVSVLAETQVEFAECLAGPARERVTVRWDALAGLPVLAGAVAQLVCTVHDRLPGGDHTILVGRVEVTVTTGAAPLVHHRRGFHRLCRPTGD